MRKTTERLITCCCEGLSIRAAAIGLDVSRQDVGAQLVAAIQRLCEHYAEVDRSQERSPWNLPRRSAQ